MDKINYKILQAEAMIDQGINDLPVGVAYYILKNKVDSLENLYYSQARKEFSEVQKEQQQQEEKEESTEQD